MSGLWSFRDTAAPLPCLSDTARASLPNAAIDDFMDGMAVEVSDTSIEDPVRVFDVAADVDGAVREVQNAWLERIVGHEKTPPYHLRIPHQEASDMATAPPEARDATLYEGEPLSSEDMIVVKSLLKMQGTSKEAKTNSRGRRRCLSTSTPPVLHASTVMSQRKGRQSLSGAKTACDTGMKAQKVINCPSDGYTQEEMRLLDGDCSAKRTPKVTRHVFQKLPCAFVERMERRAAQRRLARSALGNSSLLDRATGDVSTMQNIPAHGATKTRPTLRYDALSFELQVALISLETTQNTGTGLERCCQYEAIALRWHSAHVKKKVWRCWCNSQRIRANRCVKHAVTSLTKNAPVACVLSQDDHGSTLGSVHHAELLKLNLANIQLLRWYFVLWAAFLETARDGGMPLGKLAEIP
ncbi:hypothetical protein TraAM80_00089 [Trypanosoma rangeli]|uniref:Uncharacterized protein n=1 Tax=Trypanosoma rangeli TaxID=5698 RepID=A0A422P4U0_TRYRA|nr:uncharacterized protein TraAM80_00089 [Trypanosoma rangeli]RNF12737.1 hypothetical protein TraAM80_00089 [Trypanosoma rangeli]|eukprot:RNF12737.1 hypothetical protein TraAM80_00089 [Trypanosoma rangeli]